MRDILEAIRFAGKVNSLNRDRSISSLPRYLVEHVSIINKHKRTVKAYVLAQTGTRDLDIENVHPSWCSAIYSVN